MFLGEKVSHPVRDHSSGFLQCGVITVSGRVKLDAVTAVRAVGDANNLVQLRLRCKDLRSPLPGILDSVGEEDVGLGDVPAALVDRRVLSPRFDGHAFSERAMAHIVPVLRGQHSGTHDVVLTWYLEPTVLRAVLEGPRAGGAHGVDSGLSECSRVVVAGVNASDIVAEGSHCNDDIILRSVLHGRKGVANVSPVSVLHTLQEDVSVEEHPVISPHAF